jgi:GNAT superfamily N-acetyltransferase
MAMETEIAIRTARVEDAEAMAGVIADSREDSYTFPNQAAFDASVTEWRSNKGKNEVRDYIMRAERSPSETLACVAVANSGVVGVLLGEEYEEQALLEYLFVRSESQRRGVGRRLMPHFIKWAGDRSQVLWVVDTNHRAQTFYTRQGFQASSRGGYIAHSMHHIRMTRSSSAQ